MCETAMDKEALSALGVETEKEELKVHEAPT
jgi:hypothetical protein